MPIVQVPKLGSVGVIYDHPRRNCRLVRSRTSAMCGSAKARWRRSSATSRSTPHHRSRRTGCSRTTRAVSGGGFTPGLRRSLRMTATVVLTLPHVCADRCGDRPIHRWRAQRCFADEQRRGCAVVLGWDGCSATADRLANRIPRALDPALQERGRGTGDYQGCRHKPCAVPAHGQVV